MKKIYKFASIFLLCTIAVHIAKAQLIFNETFDYSTGVLEALNGATGFSTAWSNGSTGNTGANTLAQIVAGKIDPSASSNSTGNKLQVTLPTGVSTTVRYDRTFPLSLNGDASTQEYWLGYWLRIPAANLSTSTYGVAAQVILMRDAYSPTVLQDMRIGFGKTSNFTTGGNIANTLTMFSRANPNGCNAVNWPSGWNTSTPAQQALIGLSTTTDNVIYILAKISKGEFLAYQTPSLTVPNPNPIGNFDGYRVWFMSAPPSGLTDPIFTTYPNGHVSFTEAVTGNNLPIQTKVLRLDNNNNTTCVKDGVTGLRIRVEGNPGATPFLAEFDEIRLGRSLGDVLLPVNLEDLGANQLGKDNIINWTTVSETNSKAFHIEQSSNGSNWRNIGSVQAAGTTAYKTTYRFADNNPSAISYYRLRQEDLNGKITYSKIVKVKRSENVSVYITPNPAQQNIAITLNKSSSNNTVTITDIVGRVMLTSKFNGYKVSLPITKLTKGIYAVTIVTENGTIVEKFVKD
jgi:Secretion system C-terminal sorting domain